MPLHLSMLIPSFFVSSLIPLAVAWWVWSRRPPSVDRVAGIASLVCFGAIQMGVAGTLLACTLSGLITKTNYGYADAAAGKSSLRSYPVAPRACKR